MGNLGMLQWTIVLHITDAHSTAPFHTLPLPVVYLYSWQISTQLKSDDFKIDVEWRLKPAGVLKYLAVCHFRKIDSRHTKAKRETNVKSSKT